MVTKTSRKIARSASTALFSWWMRHRIVAGLFCERRQSKELSTAALNSESDVLQKIPGNRKIQLRRASSWHHHEPPPFTPVARRRSSRHASPHTFVAIKDRQIDRQTDTTIMADPLNSAPVFQPIGDAVRLTKMGRCFELPPEFVTDCQTRRTRQPASIDVVGVSSRPPCLFHPHLSHNRYLLFSSWLSVCFCRATTTT
jgi:hypothetical protein